MCMVLACRRRAHVQLLVLRARRARQVHGPLPQLRYLLDLCLICDKPPDRLEPLVLPLLRVPNHHFLLTSSSSLSRSHSHSHSHNHNHTHTHSHSFIPKPNRLCPPMHHLPSRNLLQR